MPEGDGQQTVDGERTTIRIKRAGGQTGMEGSCYDDEVSALDFSIDDIRALVEGRHETTLARAPFQRGAPREAEEGRAMAVDVRLVGEPRTELGCGGSIRQDVEVTLSFEDPALDVIFEETLSAFTADFALVQAELDREVAELLELPLGANDEVITVTIGWSERGMRGSMQTLDCGFTAFPADSRCEEPFQPQIDLDRDVYGVAPRAVIEELSTLGELELQWKNGGRTSLSVAIEGEPQYACGSWAETIGSVAPVHIEVPVNVRVTTGDGRVDLVIPAEVGFDASSPAGVERGVSQAAGWDGTWGVIGRGLLTQAELEGSIAEIQLPDDAALSATVRVFVLPEEGIHAELQIGSVALESDSAAPADLRCEHEPQWLAEAVNPDSFLLN